MKTCTKCGGSKPLDAFYKRRASNDGYQASCKSCVKVADALYKRKWYALNGDAARAAKVEYHRNNRSKLLEDFRMRAERLAPCYVATSLRMRASELTPELLAMKREQIEIHRLAKQVKQQLKESKK